MIFFANYDRQHAYETVRGLLRLGDPVLYLAGDYHLFRSRLARVSAAITGRRIAYPGTDEERRLVLLRCYGLKQRVGQRWRHTESSGRSIHSDFDRWACGELETYADRISGLYCYQDYLPLTVDRAGELGIPVISEQIIDNSPAAHRRLQDEMNRTGQRFPLHDEQTNLEIMGKAGAVVVPSEELKAYVAEHYSEKPVHFAPYGINPLLRRPADRKPAGDYLLVRANSVRKGSLIILAALRELAISNRWPSGLRLIFAGEFDSHSLQAADSLREMGLLIEARNFPHRELMARLPAARAFVMPSLQEGRSLLALEAAAQGVPLFLSKHVGIDHKAFGECAVFVREDTPRAWARALETVASGTFGEADLVRGAFRLARENPWSHYHAGVAAAVSGVRSRERAAAPTGETL